MFMVDVGDGERDFMRVLDKSVCIASESEESPSPSPSSVDDSEPESESSSP